MKIGKMWIFSQAVVFGFLAVGCEVNDPGKQIEGAAPGIKVDDPSQPYAGVRCNTVGILDKSLQDWSHPKKRFLFWEVEEDQRNVSKIAIEQTNWRPSATGTWETWAVIRNRTNYPLQIEGRVTFYDQQGAQAENPSAWTRLFLGPNSVETYKAFSTKNSDLVKCYYIELREGK
jgi:uncharacterized protein YcfL